MNEHVNVNVLHWYILQEFKTKILKFQATIIFLTTGCNNPVDQNPFQNVWLPLAYFLLFSILQRIRSDPKYRIKINVRYVKIYMNTFIGE